VAGAIEAGTVKPLAVASASRLPKYAAVPTVAEGVPGFSAVGWVALTVPKGTPSGVIQQLSDDLSAVLAAPAMLQWLEQLGASAPATTPEQARAFIHEEQQRWRPLVRRIGLKER
jgi:tripartite-type tricarboxylate transporter receptor subunit TctC